MVNQKNIIIIAHPGCDPKQACLRALGVSEAMDEGAFSEETDWNDITKRGFNIEEDMEDYIDVEKMAAGFVAITKIMAAELQQHFEFGFEVEANPMAPVIYGSYASDDDIVGVLSSRM